jgi:hypothetical protein
VKDTSGAVLPGVTIEIASEGGTRTTITNEKGQFSMTNVPSGQTSVSAILLGFTTARYSFLYDLRPREMTIELQVGSLQETVTVTAEAPMVDVQSARQIVTFRNDTGDIQPPAPRRPVATPPSVNVIDLQRRATGVLPVRVDVPKAGISHQFVKPLVVDQETTVTLRYKRR